MVLTANGEAVVLVVVVVVVLAEVVVNGAVHRLAGEAMIHRVGAHHHRAINGTAVTVHVAALQVAPLAAEA